MSYIIGICGTSGVGKSTICSQITNQLAKNKIKGIVTIGLDSFYHSLTDQQLKYVDTHNFDTPEAIDYEYLLNVINRLKAKKDANIPIYDFKTHKRVDDKFEHIDEGVNVIILEGILIFNNDELSKLFDFKIFVEADLDICLARRLRRDCRDRGRKVESVLDQWEYFVKPSYEKFVLPTKRECHMVIPNVQDISKISTVTKMISLSITTQC